MILSYILTWEILTQMVLAQDKERIRREEGRTISAMKDNGEKYYNENVGAE